MENDTGFEEFCKSKGFDIRKEKLRDAVIEAARKLEDGRRHMTADGYSDKTQVDCLMLWIDRVCVAVQAINRYEEVGE